MRKPIIAAFLLAVLAMATAIPLAELELGGDAIAGGKSAEMLTGTTGFKPTGDYSVEYKLKVGQEKDAKVRLYGTTAERNSWSIEVTDSAIYFTDETAIPFPDLMYERLNSSRSFNLRLGVTNDSIYVFRNGTYIGARSVRKAPKPLEAATGQTDSANLLRNADFESDADISYNTISEEDGATCLSSIDAWQLYPCDGASVWNNRAFLVSGDTGTALKIQRYSWSAGSQWADGTAQQAVNVVPGTPYKLSFLAYGGEYNGTFYGYAKIQELGTNKSKVVDIKNTDSFQEYTMDYTPSAECDQMLVIFGVKFPGGLMDWGEVPTVPVFIDNVVLQGKTYTYEEAALGYSTTGGSTVETVKVDETGAYAPTIAEISTDVDRILIDASKTGTATADFRVTAKGLGTGNNIVIVPSGYVKVTPEKLPPSAKNQRVRVTYTGTRTSATDTIVLKSGATIKKVAIEVRGKALDNGSLAQKQNTPGQKLSVPVGTAPYTIEVRAKVKAGSKEGLQLYAAGTDGKGFGINIADSAITIDNGKSAQTNPLEVHARKNSDIFHTYRISVSADNLLYVYRDGNLAATLEGTNFIMPAKHVAGSVPETENLIVNGDFNGVYGYGYVEDGGTHAYVNHIDGWDIYPIEPWNTRQYITNWEMSEADGYDLANRALKLQRYGWNAGYSDGLISQAVNVMGGKPYTLKYLAKGGIYQDKKYGYVRIEEVGNEKAKVEQSINSDSPRQYTLNYTPTASCKQVRITVGLKSPGAIGSWGATPEVPILVDKFVMTGERAIGNGTMGYEAVEGTEVEYFAYDMDHAYAPAKPEITTSDDIVRINKTNGAAVVRVTAKDLNVDEDIQVICPDGIKAAPERLKYNASNSVLRLQLTSTRERLIGKVILRSGTTKKVITVDGRGTPLEQKEYSTYTVNGNTASWNGDGSFQPSKDGYTVEYKTTATGSNQSVEITALDAKGTARTYTDGDSHGVYDGDNKLTRKKHNPERGAHTYRYAFTPDRLVFVYMDNAPLDTLQMADYATQQGLTGIEGEVSENLLNNPGFEGRSATYIMSDDPDGGVFTNYIEGWSIDNPNEGWNSRSYITEEVVGDEMGDDNHVAELERYRWEDGWADSRISQVVNVVPGATYDLSVLAMGGFRKSDDSSQGFIRIEEVETPTKAKEVKIKDQDRYKFGRYTMRFTPSAKCHQIRVVLGMKKCGKNESERARFDDVVLRGKSVSFAPALSMVNNNSTLEYFHVDPTGAYAPSMPVIGVSDDALTFTRTLDEQPIDITTSNVAAGEKVYLTTSGNFLVEPAEIAANASDCHATVTFLGTTDGTGTLVIKAGTLTRTVALTGTASELECKDISANPVYTDAAGQYSATTTTGFAPTKAGYTVEIAASLERYSGGGFEIAAVNDRGFASNLIVNDEFSAVSSELGNVDFLSGDLIANVGNFVYRLAVTPDNLGYVFKDGVPVDTLDLASLPADPSFWDKTTTVDADNLIRNGNFNGGYQYAQYEEAYMLSTLAGWHGSGLNEWNGRAYITADSENPGNNILNLQRYDWNPGWADLEFSQVVNVVPGETYVLSALTRGGSEAGFNVAHMRISEIGNSKNRDINVSNSSSEFTKRTETYKVSDNCSQIKITFSLSSTGKEGNGPKCSFYVKDVVLKGKKPVFTPGILLRSDEPFTLKYFTYDLTGAYLPTSMSGIDSVEADGEAIKALTAPGELTLTGVPEGASIAIYNVAGMQVAAADASTSTFRLAGGYYVVRVTEAAKVTTLKVFIP